MVAGSTYSLGPDTVIDTAINASKAWVFNTGSNQIDIGPTNGAGPDDDVWHYRVLPVWNWLFVKKIHSQLGLSTTIPTETNIDFNMDQTTAVGTSSDRIYTGAGTGTIEIPTSFRGSHKGASNKVPIPTFIITCWLNGRPDLSCWIEKYNFEKSRKCSGLFKSPVDIYREKDGLLW